MTFTKTFGSLAIMGATGMAIAGFSSATQANAAVSGNTYVVESGDTLSTIAQKLNLSSYQVLANANHLANVNIIYPGQKLALPNNTQTGAVQNTNVVKKTVTTKTYSAPTASTQATYSAPAQSTAKTYSAPAKSAPVQSTTKTYSAPVATGSEASAKNTIAQRESGGSYSARNGRYVGKYQLTDSYLNGDYSAANQERVANNYVASRYGSWTKALAFWNANGWY